jgi:hypothetical protein
MTCSSAGLAWENLLDQAGTIRARLSGETSVSTRAAPNQPRASTAWHEEGCGLIIFASVRMLDCQDPGRKMASAAHIGGVRFGRWAGTTPSWRSLR